MRKVAEKLNVEKTQAVESIKNRDNICVLLLGVGK